MRSASLPLLQLDLIRIGETEGPLGWVVPVTLLVLYVTVMWRLFDKAGEPPWIGPIPVVNMFFLARIAGKSMTWGLLLMIPLVGTVVWFLLCFALAERFGRGRLFGLGLAILPVIFFAELAFGSSEYLPDRHALWARSRGLA
jgi:hypothetical protein